MELLMQGAPLPVLPSDLPTGPGGGAFPEKPQGTGPRLRLEPGTLAMSVLPGEGDTSVAFDWVQAAVEAVALGRVTVAGQTGPTVAALFYAMAGTALYEALAALRSGEDEPGRAVGTDAGVAGADGPAAHDPPHGVGEGGLRGQGDRRNGLPGA